MRGGSGPVQRHQDRELAIVETHGLQRGVEPARDRPRGALEVEAQATIPDLVRCLDRQVVAHHGV